MNVSTQRITISLPAGMIERVKSEAKRSKRPVSRIVADALARQEEEEVRLRMIEGYREISVLNKQLAEEFWPIVGETLPAETWPDD
jgi:hypothetical protein